MVGKNHVAKNVVTINTRNCVTKNQFNFFQTTLKYLLSTKKTICYFCALIVIGNLTMLTPSLANGNCPPKVFTIIRTNCNKFRCSLVRPIHKSNKSHLTGTPHTGSSVGQCFQPQGRNLATTSITITHGRTFQTAASRCDTQHEPRRPCAFVAA